MVMTVLLSLGFLLNLISHKDILTGLLNVTLLFLSVYVYSKLSGKKLNLTGLPFVIFIAAIPLFTYRHDIFILGLAIGAALLLLLYANTNVKRILPLVLFVIIAYLVLASFYVGGIIKFPFVFSGELFIFFDDKASPYIPLMQKEALYLPYRFRSLIFNESAYFYVLLSKTAGLFTLKNLYDVLLLANLYPFILGVIWSLRNWDKSKAFFVSCILLVAFITSLSRTVNIFNTFLILAPFLLYFILTGFNSMNKKIYLLLFILSLIILTSPV